MLVWNMIGSIGVLTERNRVSPTTPMMLISTMPVPCSNNSLRMTFPTAS